MFCAGLTYNEIWVHEHVVQRDLVYMGVESGQYLVMLVGESVKGEE